MHDDAVQIVGNLLDARATATTTPWLDAHPILRQVLMLGLQFLLSVIASKVLPTFVQPQSPPNVPAP